MLKFRIISLAVGCMGLFSLNFSQVGGGAVYGNTDRRGEAFVQSQISAWKSVPNPDKGVFLDATVLANVKPDAYVAVFALSAEATTVEEARKQMAIQTADIKKRFITLGVKESDLDIDYVTQNRVYGYKTENVIKQYLSGFEVKQNVAVRYTSHTFIDRLLSAAAEAKVFDLVKVDAIILNQEAVRSKLIAEASKVLKQKLASYQKLMGLNYRIDSVITERQKVVFPMDLYSSYVAAESEDVTYQHESTVLRMKKMRTFYFQALNASEFDSVLNPVVLQPVVQMALYVRVQAEKTTAPKRKA